MQVRADDRELIPAHAGHRIAPAQRALQLRCHGLEKAVAGGVAPRVVHHLETIQVQKHHRQRFIVPKSVPEGVFQAILEQQAGGQPGERVMVRQVEDGFLGGSQFRHGIGQHASVAAQFEVGHHLLGEPRQAFALALVQFARHRIRHAQRADVESVVRR